MEQPAAGYRALPMERRQGQSRRQWGLELEKQRRQIPDSEQCRFESISCCIRTGGTAQRHGVLFASSGRNRRFDEFRRGAISAGRHRTRCFWIVHVLRVRHRTGQLRADLLDSPGDFRLNVESTLSPDAVRSVVPAEANEFLQEWQWQRSPTIRMTIRGTDRNPAVWRGEGTVALGRTRFRGQWMNAANARIRFADGAVICEDLHVTRDEGTGSGSFTYDFKKHEVRVSNIRSSLYPAEVIFWIDPKTWKTVA